MVGLPLIHSNGFLSNNILPKLYFVATHGHIQDRPIVSVTVADNHSVVAWMEASWMVALNGSRDGRACQPNSVVVCFSLIHSQFSFQRHQAITFVPTLGHIQYKTDPLSLQTPVPSQPFSGRPMFPPHTLVSHSSLSNNIVPYRSFIAALTLTL